MATFDELQKSLLTRTFAAYGLPPAAGMTFQPARVPDSNATLCAWFDTVPDVGSVFTPSGSEFFKAYSAVINSLVPGRGPLNPINVAKHKLVEWGTKPPAWSIDYATMLQLLAVAPAASFPFNNPGAPKSAFWGLWASSPPVDGISSLLASAKLDMTLSFGHLLSFTATPGDWYVSSALATAYSNRTGHPWDPSSPITCATTFGPDGTLARLPAVLIVADALTIHYTSQAEFDLGAQAILLANAPTGLWPYYLDQANATTTVAFDGSGRLTVTISTPAGQPVVLAAGVLSAGTYLGVG